MDEVIEVFAGENNSNNNNNSIESSQTNQASRNTRRIYDSFSISKNLKCPQDFTWTCKIGNCKKTGHQSPPLIQHCMQQHWDDPWIRSAVEDFQKNHSRVSRKRRATLAASCDSVTESSSDTSSTAPKKIRHQQTLLPFTTTKDTKTRLNEAAANLMISRLLPLDFFDNEDVRVFVAEVGSAAIHEHLTSRSTRGEEGKLDVSLAIQSRRAMVDKWLPNQCDQLYAGALEKVRNKARMLGCTLLQVLFVF
jgi:hypothetical protein